MALLRWPQQAEQSWFAWEQRKRQLQSPWSSRCLGLSVPPRPSTVTHVTESSVCRSPTGWRYLSELTLVSALRWLIQEPLEWSMRLGSQALLRLPVNQPLAALALCFQHRAGSTWAEHSQADSSLANGFSVSCIVLGPMHFHAWVGWSSWRWSRNRYPFCIPAPD